MEQIAAQMTETIARLGNGLLPITTLYIGLNALITLILAVLVVRARIQTQTAIGDGGKDEMIRAQRAHGNNVEYVPNTLLTIIAIELAGAEGWLVHALGAGLTIARLAHATGITMSTGRTIGRFGGTSLGWLVLLIGSLGCIYYGLN